MMQRLIMARLGRGREGDEPGSERREAKETNQSSRSAMMKLLGRLMSLPYLRRSVMRLGSALAEGERLGGGYGQRTQTLWLL